MKNDACRDFEEELPVFLDGEMRGAGLLGMIDHLSSCAQCRQEAEGYRRSWDAFKSLQRRELLPSRLLENPYAAKNTAWGLDWFGRALAWTPALAALLLSLFLGQSKPDVGVGEDAGERIPAAARLAELEWEKLLRGRPQGLRAAPVVGDARARLAAAPFPGSAGTVLHLGPFSTEGAGEFKARFRLEAAEKGLVPMSNGKLKLEEAKS